MAKNIASPTAERIENRFHFIGRLLNCTELTKESLSSMQRVRHRLRRRYREGVAAASKTNSSNETAPGPRVARPVRPAMGCGSPAFRRGLSFQRAATVGPYAVTESVPHSCEIS